MPTEREEHYAAAESEVRFHYAALYARDRALRIAETRLDLDIDPYEIVPVVPERVLCHVVPRPGAVTRPRREQPREPHPLLKAIWRMPEGAYLERTIERVCLYGQRERIEVLDGYILVGWGEYEACIAAGVTPRFTPVTVTGSLVDYVVRRNIPEDMTIVDRACVAVLAYQEAAKAEARERMVEGGRRGGASKGTEHDEIARPFDTTAKENETRWFHAAAKVVGCPPNTVKKVAHYYNDKRKRDVFDAMRSRRIRRLSDAEELVSLVEDRSERRAVLELFVKDKCAERNRPIRTVVAEYNRRQRKRGDGPDKGEHYTIYEGPLENVGDKIPDESVDAIYADIVYGDVKMAGDVARLATRVLVPGGLVAIINGNGPFRDVFDALEGRPNSGAEE